MSRPRQYALAAEAKRMTPDVLTEDDDLDESEWDDVSGYELGGDEDDEEQECRSKT